MQHHYIQNLQKANIFLKQKIKEFEELDKLIKAAGVSAMTGAGLQGLVESGAIPQKLAAIIPQKSNDYKLVSIG